jgi:hypothetical protein
MRQCSAPCALPVEAGSCQATGSSRESSGNVGFGIAFQSTELNYTRWAKQELARREECDENVELARISWE